MHSLVEHCTDDTMSLTSLLCTVPACCMQVLYMVNIATHWQS